MKKTLFLFLFIITTFTAQDKIISYRFPMWTLIDDSIRVAINKPIVVPGLRVLGDFSDGVTIDGNSVNFNNKFIMDAANNNFLFTDNLANTSELNKKAIVDIYKSDQDWWAGLQVIHKVSGSLGLPHTIGVLTSGKVIVGSGETYSRSVEGTRNEAYISVYGSGSFIDNGLFSDNVVQAARNIVWIGNYDDSASTNIIPYTVGNFSTLSGINSSINGYPSSTVSNWYGFINQPSLSTVNGASITNAYGFYSDYSVGAIPTNAYHFYGAGNYPSYFGGNVESGKYFKRSVNAGITASTTQSQGQQVLSKDVNEVSTVSNSNDVVTLPSAEAGLQIVIINNGANTLQIFPYSGDNLGAGLNMSTTLAAGANVTFVAYDSTNWETL